MTTTAKGTIELFGKPCGSDYPPLIVAELSGNHGGQLAHALRMIEAAVDAGADAIKIQSYTADTLTLKHDSPEFQINEGLWKGRTLHDLYQEAHTPWEWHPALFEKARELGIPLFSSPFDPTAVEMLEKLQCPAYKIASFELVDVGLIETVAATGKPVILSTGMATQSEIEEAVSILARYPATPYLLLHCLSSYPAPVEQSNLKSIPLLKEVFSVPVGLSDHTRGSTAAIAAVALGACVIEKHFVLSRSDGGVDSEFSLEPDEFRRMGEVAREAWSALGEARIGTAEAESSQTRFRRSLYIVAPIRQGEAFTNENVRSIRPGNGLHPRYLQSVIGRRATRDIAYGEPLGWEMISD